MAHFTINEMTIGINGSSAAGGGELEAKKVWSNGHSRQGTWAQVVKEGMLYRVRKVCAGTVINKVLNRWYRPKLRAFRQRKSYEEFQRQLAEGRRLQMKKQEAYRKSMLEMDELFGDYSECDDDEFCDCDDCQEIEENARLMDVLADLINASPLRLGMHSLEAQYIHLERKQRRLVKQRVGKGH